MQSSRKVAHQYATLLMSRTDENPQAQNPETLHAEWEAAYGHPLTDGEFQEIQDNLYSFFSLLESWRKRRDTRDRESGDINHDADPGGSRE